ncbi:hypothetical protein [Maribacter sp.]|uniref:hypothetical protein n=1 Tax=Maribacter sp. TaxID=1897614 RepID=UPI0025BE19C2|nr:hypothetical protein [Maribacter sp.]
MMRVEITKQKQKLFFIKSYQYLWQLEEVIQEICKNATPQLQLSVLGKLTQDCISNNKESIKDEKKLKNYWKGSLGATSDFGLFCNPEIGTLFIVGDLTHQFLHDMDGKPLGEMSSGSYGILRGLGISENNASMYIKDLNKDCFLLILRSYDFELDIMQELIENFK